MSEEQAKTKYFVLDYGDQPVMSESIDQLLIVIKEQMEEIIEGDELDYNITVKMLTQSEIDDLPEWDG